jgi:hypothetical protein
MVSTNQRSHLYEKQARVFPRRCRPDEVSPPVTMTEVVDHEPIDGRRVMGVPHPVSEGVHDIDGARCTHVACNALRSADSPRSIASVAAGTTPA